MFNIDSPNLSSDLHGYLGMQGKHCEEYQNSASRSTNSNHTGTVSANDSNSTAIFEPLEGHKNFDPGFSWDSRYVATIINFSNHGHSWGIIFCPRLCSFKLKLLYSSEND